MNPSRIQRAFTVRPVWDGDAAVWTTDSDIKGLHVEADSLEELERLVLEFAPELIVSNHFSAADVVGRPLRDLLPIIRIVSPEEAA